MKFVPTTERSEVVLFFKYSSGGAEEVLPVGDVAPEKLSYFLEFWIENCRKWSLGIYAGTVYVYFGFRHQGTELCSAEG